MLLLWSEETKDDLLKGLAPTLNALGAEYRIHSGDFPPLEALEGATALFALGGTTIKRIQDAGLLPKNKGIEGLRKVVHHLPLHGRHIPTMTSYGPGIRNVSYEMFVSLLTDLGIAIRLAQTGTTAVKKGDYRYVKDFRDLHARALQLIADGQQVEMAFDTETKGLDYLAPEGYLISLQFSMGLNSAEMVAFPNKKASLDWLWDIENQRVLGDLFNHPDIRMSMANGKYDLLWLHAQAGIECTNFVFDTTLVGSLLDENRSNGLDVHAKLYSNIGGYSDLFDKTVDKSKMDEALSKDPEAFLAYSCGDPDATRQSKMAMKAELLKDPALAGFYVNILHPAARAFELVERGGVVVDMQAYQELEADLISTMHRCIDSTKKIVGGMLVAKHHDDSKIGGINITKASFIEDFMFSPKGLNLKPRMLTEKSGKPSSTLEHLQMFSNVPEAAEFVKVMGEYAAANKTLTTYVTGFKKHLRQDGRFHPTHFLFAAGEDGGGTVTGRLSVKDPAFQTLPKHTVWGKKLRRCFPAPPGMLVLENDYSQGELRVVACIANEQNMIHAYQSGMDLHVLTGGMVAGLEYDDMLALKKTDKDRYDELRQMAKAGNFGLLYGMGVDGFVEYARVQYGVTMTYEQAEKFRNGFFATYPGLPVYHETYKAFARKNGYVRSPLGRVRHLPLLRSPRGDIRSKEERRAINSPVQSCLSDMMIWTFAEAVKMGWHHTCPAFGMVHDAKYTYIPEDNFEFYAKREVELMENLPFHKVGWNPQLTFKADAKVGPNMADLKDVEFS